MKSLAALATCALGCVPATSAAAWSANGPDGGIVHAATGGGGNLYIGTNDGVYRSSDDGANWSRLGDLPRGYYIGAVAVDPSNPSTLYATGGIALYRSTDGGAHWIETAEPAQAVTYHPGTPGDLVGVHPYSRDVRASVDGGATWQAATVSGSGAPFRAFAVVASAPDPHMFYALDGYRVVHRSSDGGRTWVPLPNPAPPVGVSSNGGRLAIEPNGDYLVLTDNQLDVGYVRRYAPWTGANTGATIAPLDSARGLLADRVAAGRFWLAAYTMNAPFGMHWFESVDNGSTWSDLGLLDVMPLYAHATAGGVLYGSGERGFVRSLDAGRTWAPRVRGVPLAEVRSVSMRPGAPEDMLAAGAGLGVARSTDGGATWSDSSTGLTQTTVSALVRSPQNPDVVYAGSNDGLFRSTDGGSTWSGVAIASFPISGQRTFGRLGVDRDDPAKLTGMQDYSRLMWSDDGGANWRSASASDGQWDFRFFPRTPAGSRIVYALAFLSSAEHRLYRAVGHGGVFEPIAGAQRFGTVAVNPANERELVALARNGTWNVWTAYRSLDAGDTWATRGALPSMQSLGDMAQLRFDACDPRTVYALAGGGFYVSRDKGATWAHEPLTLPATFLNDLDVDCTDGTASVVAATDTTGTQVRTPEEVEGIFADGIE